MLASSLFKMAPKHSAEVLCSVSMYKKAVMCLMEEMYVKISFVQACGMVLLTVSTMLMNE